MTGHSGEALELALALLRMPAQRLALRERPLPTDIDRILPITAGSRNALAAAAQATGESELLVLEAVRFYLQEILFFPDADAYRILGVPQDADIERIQQHHRQLQRWLHPDRRGNDLESGFASRVNQAWSTLRSDKRRAAYDAMLQQQLATTTENISAAPVAPMGWHRMDTGSQARWRQALPLTALAIACVLFVLLMARQPEEEAFHEWQAQTGAEAADVADSGNMGTGMQQTVSTSVQSPPPREPSRGPDRYTHAPASTMLEDRIQPGLGTVVDVKQPALASLMPIFREPASNQTVEPARSNPGNTMPAEAVLPRSVLPQSVLGDRAQQTIADTASNPKVIARPAPIPQAGTPGGNRLARSTTRSARKQAKRPALQAPTTVVPALAATEPSPAIKPPAGGDTDGTADLVERVRLARRRASEVTAFLSDPQARTPPVWNDLDTQVHAEGLRRDFQAGSVGKRLALQRPDWRISRGDARLEAAYRCRGRCSDGDHGVLRMQMGWRNGMWLVHELEMERAP